MQSGGPYSNRRSAAFEDFGHVPDDGRGIAFQQRQRGEDRSIAAASGNDDLCAGGKRVLDRFNPHHPDDVDCRVDIGIAERRRRKQGSRTAVAQVSADNPLR
jgi:hypothetical protein